MPRSVPEWVGKTDDSPIPPRVRLRVFERYGGKCFISDRIIRPGDQWQCDHRIALTNGGINAESNLVPVLVAPHKEKTRADVAEKSRVDKRRKSHLGIKKNRSITRWRRFDGSIVIASRER